MNSIVESQFVTCMQPLKYTCTHTKNSSNLLKIVLSIIIFPIGIYQIIHSLIGKLVVPASLKCMNPKSEIDLLRTRLIGTSSLENELSRIESSIENGLETLKDNKDNNDFLYKNIMSLTRLKVTLIRDFFLKKSFKHKRITIEVDGYKIDAMILENSYVVDKDKWVLKSLGNASYYEKELNGMNFYNLLDKTNSNGIVFNYPGVGESSGFVSRSAMVKAYKAVLSFLEYDKQNGGMGAKEIIGYGYSIGGGVQGDALKTHILKNNIKYVFVKDRTFSKLAPVASSIFCKLLGFLVKFFGWNINPIKSSKTLQHPEIIIQSTKDKTNVKKDGIIDNASLIVDDGVIPQKCSLGFKLLSKNYNNKKTFIGTTKSHNEDIDYSFLAEEIKKSLDQQSDLNVESQHPNF